jgi:hypothetical protein
VSLSVNNRRVRTPNAEHCTARGFWRPHTRTRAGVPIRPHDVDEGTLAVVLTELVALVVGDAFALTAIGIFLTTVVRRDTATLEVVSVTETATAGRILATRLPIFATPTLAVILLPATVVTPAVVVVVVATILLSLAAIALVGATLFVPAASFAGEPTPFDEHVVFRREAEIGSR